MTATVRARRRAIVGCVAVAMGLLLGATAAYGAPSAWWHVSTLSAPPAPQTASVTTTTPGSPTANERQKVALDTFVNGGAFTLSFEGETTAPIPYKATPAQVQAVLQVVSKLGAGNVFVTGLAGGPWTVEFRGALAHIDVPQLVADASGLSGQGVVVVDAANLGDAAASNEAHPLAIEDVLPPGVVPVHAYPQGGGGDGFGMTEQQEHASCTSSGQKLTCTYPVPVLPYEEAMIVIDVNVAPGAGEGVNEVNLSGGIPGAFAAPRVSRRPLALEGPPKPFGVAELQLTPEEEGGAPAARAGSHPFQLTNTFALNTQAAPTLNVGIPHLEMQPLALTKDARFKIPPGLLANAEAMPRCSDFVFEQQVYNLSGLHCPDDTVLGVATSAVALNKAGQSPLALARPLYNLEPAYGEPARFGFATPLPSPIVLDTAVAADEGGSSGVTVSARDITQVVEFIGSQVTFWGWPPDPRHDPQRGGCLGQTASYRNTGQLESCPLSERGPLPFLVLPASCAGPLPTIAEGLDSWAQPGVFGSPFSASPPVAALKACNQVPFAPAVSAEPTTDRASAPSGLDLNVSFYDEGLLNPEGVAQSQIDKTVVTLPEGFTVNPSAGVGLGGCTPADYARETLTSAPGEGCPNDSKLGTVTIDTPLLSGVIHGSVFIAQPYENPFSEPGQPNGSLVALYIVAKSPENGILVKLAGRVEAGGQEGVVGLAPGQLRTTFEDIPQLTFDHFDFHFREGQQAPLISPPSCGAYTTQAQLTPWSDPTKALAETSPFTITKGFDGGACPSGGLPPFAPGIRSGTLNNNAGAFSPFYLHLTRTDAEQEISGFSTDLPEGLTGDLTGIPFCPEAAIALARGKTGVEEEASPSCPASSQIGHTLVGTGVGAVLAYVPGKVYLAGPYNGDPFSLVSVTSSVVGPFDLGTVVLRFGLRIDPNTAKVSVDPTASEPIPTILHGIVTHVRDIRVYIDRSKFILNPTSCEPMAISSTLNSDLGHSATVASPFQAVNCARLAFKPSFKVSTSGKTSRTKGASLVVKLAYPAGSFGRDANIRSVKVSLPKQLPSRLTTLQKACPDSTFNANPAACSAASRVGIAKAITPVLPVPLEGPAYFVGHGGAKFPELIVVLQGYGVTINLHGETFISKAGITSSTFRTIPDQPVTSFQLTLSQGPYSALATNGNLCRSALKMPTAFTAQNGMVIHRATKIAVTGCAKHAKGGRRRAHRK